jgi:hypothetical protein
MEHNTDSDRIDGVGWDIHSILSVAMCEGNIDGHMLPKRAKGKRFQSILFLFQRGLVTGAGEGGRCDNATLGILDVKLDALVSA